MGGENLMATREHFKHLPPAVLEVFRAYHQRKGRVFILSQTLWLALIYAALVLAATHLDRWLRFESGARVTGWWVTHAVVAALLAGSAWLAWRRSRPTTALAYEIEAGLEKPQEHLVAAYELLAPTGSTYPEDSVMKTILADGAEKMARAINQPPRPRDRWRPIALGALTAMAIVYGVLLAIPAYEFPLMLARFYRPLTVLPHPSFTKIAIGTFPNPIGQGNDITIPVRLSGRLAKEAFIELTAATEPRIPKREKLLRVGPDTFLHTVYNARADFAFRIRAGDGETDERRVRVVEQPRVECLTVTVDAPAYAQMKPAVYENPTEVRALEGSRVTSRITCGQELQLAQVIVTGEDGVESRLPVSLAGGTGLWTVEDLKQNLFFRLALKNREGFENLDQDQRQLLSLKDKPPEVVIEGGQDVVTMFPTEERVFEVSATDDLGLQELTSSFAVNPDPDAPQEPRRAPVKTFTPPVREARAEASVRLEELNVEPGDIVEMRLEGMDTHRSFGRSGKVVIQVISFDPGLEEQQRIQALRVLSLALVELSLPGASGPAPGRLGMDAAALQRVRALGEKLGVEVLPLEGAPVPLLERFIAEQDLTPFHGYKDDLRAALTLASLALLGDALGTRRAQRLGLLGTELLPAAVQFRFHRNLLRALGAFRAELDRLGPDKEGAFASADKRVGQLRISLEKWMGHLAEISRDSRAPDSAFAVFESEVEAINTTAFSLRANKPDSAQALRAALNRLIAHSQALLGPLAERLERFRAQTRETVQSDMRVFVDSLPEQPEGRASQREVVKLLRRTLESDPASAPESRIGVFLLNRLLMADGALEPADLAACRAWLTDEPPSVRHAEVLYRERSLQALLSGIRENKAMSEWNRDYDRDQFLLEHRRVLQRLAPEVTDEAAAFARRVAQSAAFKERLKAILPPASLAVPAAVARFLEAQAKLRAELEATAQRLAVKAEVSSVEERNRILTAYDQAERRGSALLETLRLYLTVEGLSGGSASPAWTLGWTRALVRLEERLDHFRMSCGDAVGVMRAFAGKEFDIKERETFPLRLTFVIGTAKGLDQACVELAPVAAGREVGPEFFVAEARRLPLAGLVETMAQQAAGLAAAAALAEGEARRAVGDVLKANPELQNDLVVDHLRPGVQALRKQISTMSAEAKPGKAASAERWQRLADTLLATRQQTAALLASLQKLDVEQAREVMAPLQRIAERLRGLPAEPKQIEGQMALFAFTLTEAERQVEQFQRTLIRETPSLATPVARKAATLEENARLAARPQFEGNILGWKTVSAERLFAYQQKADADGLRRAAFDWQAATGLSLSPVMLRGVKSILTGKGGKDVKERRHWLVQEFEASLRLALPPRHKTETKSYFDNLKGKFREYEHTR